MIAIDAGDVRFNYRVAGVCIHDSYVLLHQLDTEAFWALPGGRPELLETSSEALLREMQEEMGLRVDIKRLLWIVEGFFSHACIRFHELGFYYLMHLPAGSGGDDVGAAFTGVEGECTINFRWFPVDALETIPLCPSFLRTAIAHLPPAPVHLIHTDPEGEEAISPGGQMPGPLPPASSARPQRSRQT